MGGLDHILSPSYLWAVYHKSRAPHKSSLHKLHKNVYQARKWYNHVQQLAVKKDTVVEKAFIDFLVVKSDKENS